MTALITFICIFIGLAFTAGSFYWGYKIGIIKKNSDDDKIELQNAVKHIDDLEKYIEQLLFDKEQLQSDLQRKPVTQPSGWNPADPLNSAERR